MARGRVRSLTENVDEKDIIKTNEEVNPPNILIDDEYGITGGVRDYALVHKKVSHRMGKEEDGENNGKVIRYYKWEDVNYSSTIVGIFNNYLNEVALSKTKKLNKCNDFREVANIYKEIKSTISNCVKEFDIGKDVKDACNLSDKVYELNNELNNVKHILKEANALYDLIKEKRKIIVDNTKTKK